MNNMNTPIATVIQNMRPTNRLDQAQEKRDGFSVKCRSTVNVCSYLCRYDLYCSRDLDPMTLIYDNNLDILKIYLHTKNEVYRPRISV